MIRERERERELRLVVDNYNTSVILLLDFWQNLFSMTHEYK